MVLVRFGHHRVGNFKCKQRGERLFVGDDVNQASAQDDGVLHRKHFEIAGHQDAAVQLDAAVDVVGDHDVVHDCVEKLLDFALWRHEADTFENIENIVL